MSVWEPCHWNNRGEGPQSTVNDVARKAGILRNSDTPIFSVDTLERNASKGHGLVTSVAAGNNILLVGTNKGWIVRHDFSGANNTLELDLGARGIEQWIPKVFIDSGGRHSIFTVCSSATADTYYLHGKSRKPMMFSRLKGSTVSCVAWNQAQINEAFTREVIVGTTSGQLYETAVEEKDKKEKFCKLLFELTEAPEPFVGVQMEVVSLGSSTRYFVMAATPSRLYTFQGTGSLEVVFKAYSEGPAHFTELPGGNPNSELQFYGKQPRAERFAWLAGPGIYHGDLNLGTAQSANHDEESNVEAEGSNVETVESNVEAEGSNVETVESNVEAVESNVEDEESNVIDEESVWLLEYSKLMDGPGPGPGTPRPFSLALSEFHFVVLMDNMLKVVNRVSQKVVEEQRFDTSSDLGSPTILGLCSDVAAGAYYAYDENSIFAITVEDEGRDMWQVYLGMEDLTAALKACQELWERDIVYAEMACVAFEEHREKTISMHAGGVCGGVLECTLCLLEAEENQTLLRGRL